jgi:translation initiation factor 4G
MESEDARKKRVAEEDAKKERERAKKEAEEKAKKEAEEMARREEEERLAEAKRKEEEEKERVRKLEEERIRKEEEEKERLRKEAEEKERLRKEEVERAKEEVERKRKAEEEELRKAAEEAERIKKEAEAKVAAEIAPKDQEDGEVAEQQEEPVRNMLADTREQGKDKLRDKENLRIDTSASPAAADLPRKRPGRLDLSNTKTPIVAGLPSALATARIIDDIGQITYPEGIKSPKVELNINAKDGKFK